jgi:outer membrane biosynthesis protein TonB
MVPVVAAVLLNDKAPPLAGSDAVDPPQRSVRCAALQWAMANARAEKVAAPAELAAAFRYALMFRLEDLERSKDTTSERAKALLQLGYPLHVARLELTGSVRVRYTRDEQGRITEAQVVRRKLSAPGLEGQRPVFFETALDAASIAKARALPPGPPGAGSVEFVWKLE